jgi:hypothetical protein
MEIVSLKFVASEDDLNNLLVKFVTPSVRVRNLNVHVTPDGLSLMGIYETVISIPFDSVWKISVGKGRIVARLSRIKVAGVRLDFLKSYMLKALRSNTSILEADEEGLVLDIDRLLEKIAVPIRTNLTSVSYDSGRLVIEGGSIA